MQELLQSLQALVKVCEAMESVVHLLRGIVDNVLHCRNREAVGRYELHVRGLSGLPNAWIFWLGFSPILHIGPKL